MIRAAKSADLDILCDFQQELVDAERPFDPTIKEGKVIYYDIAEYRGQGVNSKVMETLKAWSLSHGVTEIRLEVYAQNNAALKAYLKSGFKPHVMEMRMEC